MNINDKKPEDVLEIKYLEIYKELHEDIWHRLVEINTSLTILEKIQKFPFDHFYGPDENVFWNMVYWNFKYTCIILLHSLVSDQKKDAHSLPKFKNKVRKWLKDSEKSEYDKNLKKLKFDNITESIFKKTSEIRHQLLAHRLFDKNGFLSKPKGIKVLEIRQMYDATEKIFQSCNFGTEYICTLYPGETCGGKPIEKDIDCLLDLIVKDSYWLIEPERNPSAWQFLKPKQTQEEISELNKYRQKFGLPTI